jgi:hypothetical protein
MAEPATLDDNFGSDAIYRMSSEPQASSVLTGRSGKEIDLP